MFWTYIGIVFFLLLFNVIDSSFMMLLTVIITTILMKKICEKENEMFQSYLIENKIFNSQTLKCIMGHYRNLVKQKVVSDNFWSIIAIAISVLLAFVTKDGFDFNSFEKALPYLISFTFITLTILFSIKQFSEIRTFLKGEEGMYERLEVYIECLKENDIPKNKKNYKNKTKKYST